LDTPATDRPAACYILATQVEPLQKVAWPSCENAQPIAVQEPAGAVAGPLYRFADMIERASDPLASPEVPLPNANAEGPVREIPVSQEELVTEAVDDQQKTFKLGNSLYPMPDPAAVLFQE